MKKKIFILGVSMLLLAGCKEKVIPTLENGEEAIVTYNDGKDKISDLTVNLILDYLASYTQKFAIENIDEKFLDYFYLDSIFNFKTFKSSSLITISFKE